MLGEEVLRIIKILMESENPSIPYICRDQTDDVSGLDLYRRISLRSQLGDFLESSSEIFLEISLKDFFVKYLCGTVGVPCLKN